ncbi:transcription elongation factor TFIIS [Gnomoniopsis smithogilvyi]|uniref:Transcription elongation factor n=1 Tax=Gnomoniopsis smithogilvyi TaxID=1191159 RepID=A0A9W9CY96_9PEZI|nr:transcription elongation factor TFIIS [Gnomoniopsis smithogilvyi]
MDEKKLREHIVNLKRAIDKKEPPSTIVTMLKALEREDAPTEDVLRATKAGQHIGKLRHNSEVPEEVRAEAKKVVDKWKQAVQQKKPSKGVMAPTRTSTPSQTASPVPPPTPSNNKPYEGDIEKRDFRKTDNVRYNVTDSTTRNNCMGLMYNGLAYMCTDSVETVTAKATEVEAAAFKHFGGENAEYRAKMRSLFQNLKVKSNKELRRRVMSGEITAIEFIKMSQDELKSQEHKERDKAYEKENINNAQVAQPEKSISDALTCGKCGQKKVSYTQAQTRSADEPMTTFCECLACGNRWKFS